MLPLLPVVLELPGVWPAVAPLLDVPLVPAPACADILTAQPSTMANVAPVHNLFMRILPMNNERMLVQSQRHSRVLAHSFAALR